MGLPPATCNLLRPCRFSISRLRGVCRWLVGGTSFAGAGSLVEKVCSKSRRKAHAVVEIVEPVPGARRIWPEARATKPRPLSPGQTSVTSHWLRPAAGWKPAWRACSRRNRKRDRAGRPGLTVERSLFLVLSVTEARANSAPTPFSASAWPLPALRRNRRACRCIAIWSVFFATAIAKLSLIHI